MGAQLARRSNTGNVSSMPSVHPRQPARDRESPTQACRFVREGEYWTITFEGTVCRFRHARGFQHLARLLGTPGRPIPATQLAGGARAPGQRQVSPSSSTTAERARSAVTKTIKAAIRRLGMHDAALGFHLGATIKTGVLCVYTPDPGRRIRWVVEDRSTGS
jgi:hypothetical protein